MSKTAKIILIVLAIPVVLVAAAAIFLKVYFTQDRLKALIIPKVESTIQRDVSVGKVSLKIFPNLAIKMASLEISGPRQGAFAKNEFFKVDEIVLDVGLKPLLRREMQVDQIIVKHPQVYLEVNKEGLNNYTFPTPPQQAAPAQPKAAGKPFALFLSDFQLSDGVVEYVDYQGDTRFLIDDLDQELSMQVTGGGKDAAIETQATIGGVSFGSTKSFLIANLPVTNFERLSYKSDADLLTIDSARIGLREIALSARGSISNMTKQPTLDLSIQSTQAELSQLLSLVPQEFLKASEGLQTTGKVQFALTVKGIADSLNQPEVKGSFTLNDGSIRYAALPKSITNVNVAGSFEQPAGLVKKPPAGRLDVEKLSATLGSNPINGKL
ncbi:MAG TPA: AsmA family protein, partial [bacterium]